MLMRACICAVLALLIETHAAAQEHMICAPYEIWIKQLGATYGEVPVVAGHGMDDTDYRFVILASPRATWTLLMLVPPLYKVGCVRAGGTDWHAIKSAMPPVTPPAGKGL